MYSNISTSRSLPNPSSTFVTGETSKNAPPSVSKGHDDSVPTSNPPIISTEKAPSAISEEKQKDTNNAFLHGHPTWPSSLQVEYRQQQAVFDGENSDRYLLREVPSHDANSDRGVEGDTRIVHIDDGHLATPATPSPTRLRRLLSAVTSPPSWLIKNLIQQKTGTIFDGERSDRHLLRQFSSHDANSGRGVEGDTRIVHIDDVHPTPSPHSRRTTSPMGLLVAPSWLTNNAALRKTGAILGETINHATIAAIVWGIISPLVNRANGANSVDSRDFWGNFEVAAQNVLAMTPISFVLSNTLFPILRGIMGYKIEKAELDAAFLEPGIAARLREAQKDTDYNGAIADVLYSCVFGAGMAAGSQIPAWAKEAGFSENDQQIVNSAIQMAIAAGALALVRTSLMLLRTVDGQPAYQIKPLGHNNPFTNLAEQFKAITQTKRRDEPSNISPNYQAIRNLTLRMFEEASVWGGVTLCSLPSSVNTLVSRGGANDPLKQFLSGYMTVTLGYFLDSGNSLNKVRINEDFSPWKLLGARAAAKEFKPAGRLDFSRVRALDNSADMATVVKALVKDTGDVGKYVLNAKNVGTVILPRVFLESLTTVEHELMKLLAPDELYRTNQRSSVQIEEIDSSEMAQAQHSSISLQTGNEEAISHSGEVAPTDTHDNPAPPIETAKQSHTNQKPSMEIEETDSSDVAQAQDSSTPLQTGNEEAISHSGEVAPTDTHDNPLPPIETAKQSRTNQKPSMEIEEIDSSDVAKTQHSSTPLQTGNEEAISHIIQAAPADINDKAELAKKEQGAPDLAIENETQAVDITDQN